jgi:hypothetical protein
VPVEHAAVAVVSVACAEWFCAGSNASTPKVYVVPQRRPVKV